jgi:PPM family protein phosphatase
MNKGISNGCVTNPGIVRDHNEDYVGYYPAGDSILAVVADGMGGLNAGETASKLTVETLRDLFLSGSEKDPAHILMTGIIVANRLIIETAEQNPDMKGMGATVVAAIVREDKCWYVHVGDSRIYWLEDGIINRVTRDHTEVQRLLDASLINAQEAATHPMAHVVYRAVGHLPLSDCSDIEVCHFVMKKGDGILLCSDGLTDLVSDEDIYRQVLGKDPQKACNDLLNLTFSRGAHDNVSIQFLRFGSVPVASNRTKQPRRVTVKEGIGEKTVKSDSVQLSRLHTNRRTMPRKVSAWIIGAAGLVILFSMVLTGLYAFKLFWGKGLDDLSTRIETPTKSPENQVSSPKSIHPVSDAAVQKEMDLGSNTGKMDSEEINRPTPVIGESKDALPVGSTSAGKATTVIKKSPTTSVSPTVESAKSSTKNKKISGSRTASKNTLKDSKANQKKKSKK